MTEGEKLGIELSVIFARHAESEYQKQAYAELEKLERGFGILKNDRGSEDSFSDKNSFIKKDGVALESSGRFLGANSHGHDAVQADKVATEDKISKPGNNACTISVISSSGSSNWP